MLTAQRLHGPGGGAAEDAQRQTDGDPATAARGPREAPPEFPRGSAGFLRENPKIEKKIRIFEAPRTKSPGGRRLPTAAELGQLCKKSLDHTFFTKGVRVKERGEGKFLGRKEEKSKRLGEENTHPPRKPSKKFFMGKKGFPGTLRTFIFLALFYSFWAIFAVPLKILALYSPEMAKKNFFDPNYFVFMGGPPPPHGSAPILQLVKPKLLLSDLNPRFPGSQPRGHPPGKGRDRGERRSGRECEKRRESMRNREKLIRDRNV